MNVEKLIECIRNYPVLYDQSSAQYRNAEYKDRIWREIATDMGGKRYNSVYILQ